MLKCSLCEYKSNKKYNLNRHMVSKHNNDKYKNATIDYKNVTINNKNVTNDCKNATNYNKCLKCSKILSSNQYLNKHLLICKGISNVIYVIKYLQIVVQNQHI